MKFCSLYSGSSGNSIFVASDNSKVLIDAGLSGKTIEKALKEIKEDPNEIDGIFVTHEHSDHIKGVGVLSRKYNIPIYANELTWKAMMNSIGKIKDDNIKIITQDYIEIKDMNILNYKIPHDAASPCGYKILSGNKSACVATDLGHFADEVKSKISDADVILLESNHDVEMLKFGPYPYPLKRRILSEVGHLSNEDCGKAIVDIAKKGKKKIILGHLSRTNNYPELAYKTVVNELVQNGIEIDGDISISMAKRDMPSNYIEF
ncbi:phosphoribosyl 1,2-cyclic phosphodiesterase [Clostridium acetobutylicum]|uniref:Metallo-beta-lactamase superfamily hydrolase n=1 Tax=Clostridium acetobutylicum (strain ATCC 824 / DSM 792 / JCM 1419 / IAM 19013 / LMG 5710 / NBRC 13948 / NRRL B-527 / VKM B-1787 / 2291 / W) TaxID=272562 RepID=Q97DE0_CLOAB|nr:MULTISPECIES: MBL fold metallo-hydrolase [Clostridium]AAK81463.1 Metallo-beta-lactamase superfamily hydrolase [Clostridium acetobutylicum ATCC 824]ADZ22581.1 Metallo-beta-lactamase superfamily hydrolase [Clostridium acetobutylicum EA 2018]AEI32919.1 metallo-beta-lactamase superfamily hydrolase [Clostridium acetobutylicum DSM 1731]AWV80864.1 MBL fold metallo-hydrolase [Clostridium acetobutylicum]KHD36574.1 metallohydrolase [Clostridium acetobutylicum]